MPSSPYVSHGPRKVVGSSADLKSIPFLTRLFCGRRPTMPARHPAAARQRALFVKVGANVVMTVPLARKGERLSRKSQSYRKRDTSKQHLHDYLPTFRACIISQPCHSFCDARHGNGVFSRLSAIVRPPLPTALNCRGIGRLLCRERQWAEARLCLFRG